MVLARWITLGRGVFGVIAAHFFAVAALAQTAWINPSSGFWREAANWSAGAPSLAESLTLITNANSKTVTIDPSTPLANLEVDRLTVSAPAGQTNMLLLENLAATANFRVIGLAALNQGGAMRVTNSTLFVDGDIGGAMDVNAGELTLVDGAVTLGPFGRFRVGMSAAGTVNILGGIFTAGDTFIIGGGTAGQGTVNMSGSGELRVALNIVIGDDPGTSGTMTVNGGMVVATNDVMVSRIGDDGTGVFTLQDGAVEFWDLSIGRSVGSDGTLNISAGTLQAYDISLGRFAGATGTLNISGGSLLLPDDSLLIGREGTGQVNISGGVVVASDVLIATNSASTGTLTMTGGILETEFFDVGAAEGAAAIATINAGAIRVSNNITNATNGMLRVVRGTMTVNGGSLDVYSLGVTNSAGSLLFNGGTIVSAGTRVANGQPFVVGDGVRPAVFRMNGGVHSFANGLVISPNASVVGCGQIIGAIQNNGTLSTNCGVTAPMLLNASRNGNQFAFAIQSEAGVVYTVEYKDSLSDPAWTKLGTYTGTGGQVPVTDTTGANTRFYRVVIY